jgi:hypothetical protein
MTEILEGLKGQVCLIDDVLIYGKDQEEHDQRLAAVLDRLAERGVTLNIKKCQFKKTTLKFLGHVLDENGVRPDPEKTEAIQQMQPPKNVSDLRRFLGVTNQLGKFSLKLAALTQPLRELLKRRNSWTWGQPQTKAFADVKRELQTPAVLQLYNLEAETKIATDASSYGLDAVLLQRASESSDWKPVAYASRSLSEIERRYAQIEKEALAITWACTKLSTYLLGRQFTIQTDHKPFIPLLGSKQLDNLPPRILRFRLQLARYGYSIEYAPGKTLYIPDTLSRAPLETTDTQIDLQSSAESLMEVVVSDLPVTADMLQEYRQRQKEDPVCSTIIYYCQRGWPKDKSQLDPTITSYWEHQTNLTIGKDLLLYGNRIVIPAGLQRDTIEKIHQGHQGIEKCRLRAKRTV